MAFCNRTTTVGNRMQLRIGVHLGDIIVDGEDIYGDGVNIAARLEGIAEPGGICISQQAFDQIEGKLPLTWRPLGPQTLKNIPKLVDVYSAELADVARADRSGTNRAEGRVLPCARWRETGLCQGRERATFGEDRELDEPHPVPTRKSPALRHLFLSLARDFTLLRYDARGNGMSDWDVDQLSLDAWVTDIETVVNAAGLDRFPLFAMSQGCAISVAFAVRHPERVSHLILYGGFARGAYIRAKNELELQKAKALASLIRTGWGDDSPAYRQLFSSLFMPGATHEQLEKFAELQRVTTTPECAYRYFETTRSLDLTDLLPKVRAPTLVMHVRGDQVQPFDGGRELAAGIPGARFVALQGRNHMLLPQDPATARVVEEIRLFLKI